MDGYLTKPFDSEVLLAKIENLLQNERLRKKAFAQENQTMGKSDAVLQEDDLRPYDEAWLVQFRQIVQKEIKNSQLKIPDIAQKMAVSERTLRNRIKELTGMSPNDLILETRLEQARVLIKNRHYQTVSEVAYAVGFNSRSYFAKMYRERYGVAPSESN